MKCKICSANSVPFAVAQILNKYDIQYYSCERCGFVQTEKPYWLDEAYENVIAKSDIGLISRNLKISAICATLLPLSFPKGRYLDFGGGNGMFVRIMRDQGFDFYWYDKFAENRFATGFEADDSAHYSLVTAFELFEHLENPLDEIEKMFNYSRNIVFSTRLLPRWKIDPSQWWYYALETGQHISFYTDKSLRVISKKFNVYFSSNGISLHIFSERKISGLFLKALSFYPFSSFLAPVLGIRRGSLLPGDYFFLTGKHLD